eukprot:gnl/TRDRNA2_/TRDRNA2_115996_c0_seq2.p1 gnl/TRDRNA2_/TRDRNA2_115996_c0~~gnl/TRDRNA2_/TRDRNA2_115996_c0_seq2.p1  ORF type:complete len:341 (-),score=47.61 gnl/TRDRNA2_/TRDRNA2_115996_c0_seq2:154-1176(-)
MIGAVLLSVVIQAHAAEPVAHAAEPVARVTASVGLQSEMIEKLLERERKLKPRRDIDLDRTTLEKTSNLAASPCTGCVRSKPTLSIGCNACSTARGLRLRQTALLPGWHQPLRAPKPRAGCRLLCNGHTDDDFTRSRRPPSAATRRQASLAGFVATLFRATPAVADEFAPSRKEAYEAQKAENAATVERYQAEKAARDADSSTPTTVQQILSDQRELIDGPEGLKYLDLKVGEGETPKTGDDLDAFYTLKPAGSGGIIDSGPIAISLGTGSIIKGWEMAIVGAGNMPAMKVGGTRKVLIPSDLAYGKYSKFCFGPICRIQGGDTVEIIVEIASIARRGES